MKHICEHRILLFSLLISVFLPFQLYHSESRVSLYGTDMSKCKTCRDVLFLQSFRVHGHFVTINPSVSVEEFGETPESGLILPPYAMISGNHVTIEESILIRNAFKDKPLSREPEIQQFVQTHSRKLIHILAGSPNDNRPLLVLVPFSESGLGNRLQAIVSAAMLCLAANVTLRIYAPEYFVSMKAVYSPLQIDETTLNKYRESAHVIDHNESVPLIQSAVNVSTEYSQVFPSSVTVIELFERLDEMIDRNPKYQSALAKLGIPFQERMHIGYNLFISLNIVFQRVVHSYAELLFNRTSICAHIRTGGAVSNYPERVEFLKGNVSERVRQTIINIVDEKKWKLNESVLLFVASDSSKVITDLLTLLPMITIVTFDEYKRCHSAYGSTNRLRKMGVQQCWNGAMIDSLILSFCPVLVMTPNSSFSKIPFYSGDRRRTFIDFY